MKNILLFLLLAMSVTATAQPVYVGGNAKQITGVKGALQVDSTLLLPFLKSQGDTTLLAIDNLGRTYRITKTMIGKWIGSGSGSQTIDQTLGFGNTTNKGLVFTPNGRDAPGVTIRDFGVNVATLKSSDGVGMLVFNAGTLETTYGPGFITLYNSGGNKLTTIRLRETGKTDSVAYLSDVRAAGGSGGGARTFQQQNTFEGGHVEVSNNANYYISRKGVFNDTAYVLMDNNGGSSTIKMGAGMPDFQSSSISSGVIGALLHHDAGNDYAEHGVNYNLISNTLATGSTTVNYLNLARDGLYTGKVPATNKLLDSAVYVQSDGKFVMGKINGSGGSITPATWDQTLGRDSVSSKTVILKSLNDEVSVQLNQHFGGTGSGHILTAKDASTGNFSMLQLSPTQSILRSRDGFIFGTGSSGLKSVILKTTNVVGYPIIEFPNKSGELVVKSYVDSSVAAAKPMLDSVIIASGNSTTQSLFLSSDGYSTGYTALNFKGGGPAASTLFNSIKPATGPAYTDGANSIVSFSAGNNSLLESTNTGSSQITMQSGLLKLLGSKGLRLYGYTNNTNAVYDSTHAVVLLTDSITSDKKVQWPNLSGMVLLNTSSLSAASLLSGTIPAARYGAGTIDVSKINASGGGTGKVLSYDGIWVTPSGGGSSPSLPLNEVAFGTGSGISSSPQLKIIPSATGALLEMYNSNPVGFSGIQLNDATNSGFVTFLGYGNSDDAFRFNTNGKPINFKISNVDALSIASNRFVGIGTSGPQSELDVNGTILSSKTTFTLPTDGDAGVGGLRFSFNASPSNLYGFGMGSFDGGGRVPIWYSTGVSNGGDHIFYTGGYERMRIGFNGITKFTGSIESNAVAYPNVLLPAAPASGCITYASGDHLFVICAGESSPTQIH